MSKFIPTIHPWNQACWQSLTNDSERTSHALLFTGHQGLGKQSLAAALTHFILTDNHSQSADLFNAGSHPDLHVIMPEVLLNVYLENENILGEFGRRYLEAHKGKPKKVISIEQVRQLGDALTTHPHISQTRIVLIIGADCMNMNAANALLKNLEEPPANTLFILVTNELAKLPKTIRSRCSLVNFRAPEVAISKTWLAQQNSVPKELIDSYLAMANNHPLLAIELHNNNYVDSLKSIFSDVNGLWGAKLDPIQAAKNWQQFGAASVVEVLQKLTTDFIRCSVAKGDDIPVQSMFFPVQQPWVKAVARKLSMPRLINIVDELIYAKKMLATTVDELLVLETVSNQIRQLPT